MANDNVEVKEVNTTDNLLNELADLKSRMDGMIPVDKYKELESQNKKILTDYVNTRPAPKQTLVVYKKEDLDNASRKLVDLGKRGVTNREYVEASLEHRKISLDLTRKDPYGQNGEPSAEATRAAEFFQYALDNSNSASQFRMLLDQGVNDDPQVLAKVREYRAQVNSTKNRK